MLAEFIEASVHFTSADVGKMYAVIATIALVVVVVMFKSATAEKDD